MYLDVDLLVLDEDGGFLEEALAVLVGELLRVLVDLRLVGLDVLVVRLLQRFVRESVPVEKVEVLLDLAALLLVDAPVQVFVKEADFDWGR